MSPSRNGSLISISSLRSRLFILALLATLPGLALVVYTSTHLLLTLTVIICAAISYLALERERRMSAANAFLKIHEESLHMLSTELMRVQETEREHIARELHDDVGQNLTAVKINLQMIKASHPDLSPTVDESIRILERILKAVRDLSLDLRPPLMDEAGLHAALRWYVAGQSERWPGVRIDFRASIDETRVGSGKRLGMFRIVQEAVTNIVKHANAKAASISLNGVGDHIEIRIEDDGCGFDIFAYRQNREGRIGLGLIGMQERVKQMDGDFEIESRATQGTCIRVRIPFDDPRPAA